MVWYDTNEEERYDEHTLMYKRSLIFVPALCLQTSRHAFTVKINTLKLKLLFGWHAQCVCVCGLEVEVGDTSSLSGSHSLTETKTGGNPSITHTGEEVFTQLTANAIIM